MALYRKSASGEFPEYGAIFISSRTTKQECIQRKLFGLPLSSADFVKAIRYGMILFLFEYEQRKLYGVFEAVSDGQMNILHHAYRSSQKRFPAQVRVRVIWDCLPLTEDEFCHAIRDNYYNKHKFKFGLSKEQVYSLLRLFDAKRIELDKPLGRKKTNKRKSRCSDSRNLVTDSGEPGREKTDLMVNNRSSLPFGSFSPDSGITSSYHPRSHGSDDLISSEIEANTQTACGLGDLSVSGHRQALVHEEVMHVNVSPTCSPPLGDYIPLSSTDCCDIEVDTNTKACLKALYADTIDKRRSVFSRLNLNLQSAALENEHTSGTLEGYSRQLTDPDLVPKIVHQEEENLFEADRSVNKILEILEQRHDNWIKVSKSGHSKSPDDRNTWVTQRTSVFSRLSFTSESAGQVAGVGVFSRSNFQSQMHKNDKVNTSLG